ncbi:MAG: GldG family protein [Chloroflexi bacterium]|nr:GldG family protein [Chloroflexota bacterium]
MTPRNLIRTLTRLFDTAPFAVAAAGVGLVALVTGAVTSVLIPALESTGTWLALAGVGSLLLSLLDTLRRSNSPTARRRRRYGLNVALMLATFLAILGVANFLSLRTDVRFDTTFSQRFTLAEQTRTVLDDLDHKVEATAFFVERFEDVDPLQSALRDRTESLLSEFERIAPGRFAYRFVDPETDPVLASEKGVDRYPGVLFESTGAGARYFAPAASNVEQAFLTGLLVASGSDQKTVYVLTGHGELAVDDAGVTSNRGFALAVEGLRNDSYQVAPLNLQAEEAVPEDAAVLLIPSPMTALTEGEQQALSSYLKRGGGVLALLEPEADDSWRAWVLEGGVSVGDGYVIDSGSHVAGTPGIPLITPSQYAAPYITSQLDSTLFPGLAPVGLFTDPQLMPTLVDLDFLAATTPVSFASAQISATAPGNDDLTGPFLVGVIMRMVGPLTEPPPDAADANVGTLGVFGDGEFASNRFFPALSNGDLFLNVVNELAGDVPLVQVRAKPLEFRALVLTGEQLTLVRLLGWLVLPVLTLVLAAVAWGRTR